MDAIFGKEQDGLRALYYPRQSFKIDPQDPQTSVYDLAFGDKATVEPAQKHFRQVLEMDVPEELRGHWPEMVSR
jgi:hypothetical protein